MVFKHAMLLAESVRRGGCRARTDPAQRGKDKGTRQKYTFTARGMCDWWARGFSHATIGRKSSPPARSCTPRAERIKLGIPCQEPASGAGDDVMETWVHGYMVTLSLASPARSPHRRREMTETWVNHVPMYTCLHWHVGGAKIAERHQDTNVMDPLVPGPLSTSTERRRWKRGT